MCSGIRTDFYKVALFSSFVAVFLVVGITEGHAKSSSHHHQKTKKKSGQQHSSSTTDSGTEHDNAPKMKLDNIQPPQDETSPHKQSSTQTSNSSSDSTNIGEASVFSGVAQRVLDSLVSKVNTPFGTEWNPVSEGEKAALQPAVAALMNRFEGLSQTLLDGSPSDSEQAMEQILEIVKTLNDIKNQYGGPGPNFTLDPTTDVITIPETQLLAAIQGAVTPAERFEAIRSLYNTMSRESNLLFAFNLVDRNVVVSGPLAVDSASTELEQDALTTISILHNYGYLEELIHALQSLGSPTVFPESAEVARWLYEQDNEGNWSVTDQARAVFEVLALDQRASSLITEEFYSALVEYVRGEDQGRPALDYSFEINELDPLMSILRSLERDTNPNLAFIAASMTQDAGYFSRVLYAIMQYANNESFAGMSGATLREFILDCLEEYHTTPRGISPNSLGTPNDSNTANPRDNAANHGDENPSTNTPSTTNKNIDQDLFELTPPDDNKQRDDSDNSESTIAWSATDAQLRPDASPWVQQRSEVLDLAIARQKISLRTVPLLVYDPYASDILDLFGGSVDFIPSNDVGYMAVAYIDGNKPTILYNEDEIKARRELGQQGESVHDFILSLVHELRHAEHFVSWRNSTDSGGGLTPEAVTAIERVINNPENASIREALSVTIQAGIAAGQSEQEATRRFNEAMFRFLTERSAWQAEVDFYDHYEGRTNWGTEREIDPRFVEGAAGFYVAFKEILFSADQYLGRQVTLWEQYYEEESRAANPSLTDQQVHELVAERVEAQVNRFYDELMRLQLITADPTQYAVR